MKRIENVTDFISWAKEINFKPMMKDAERCDFQDIYARSGRNLLDRLFVEAEADRRLINCSVRNVMSFDEVEHLLEVLAKHKCEKQHALENEWFNRRDAELEKKEYYVEQLEKKCEELKTRLEKYVNDMYVMSDELVKHKIYSEKYLKIKELLK